MRADEVVSIVQEKIKTGELKPGDRLPTHRDMAWDLKCSVGTITRAYGDLERRGFTDGQVGRGTFVAPVGKPLSQLDPLSSFAQLDASSGNVADLSLNRFYHPSCGSIYADAFRHLSERYPQPSYSDYIDTKGRDEDLEAAQCWLEILVGHVPKKQIVVTQGAQACLFLTMQALAKPGDSIATEAFGYPGIKAAAQETGLKIQTVDMDAHGMIPEIFEDLCRRFNIKLLVTNPTNHNPTGTTLPLSRRHEIIEIANRHNVVIVEDGVYGPFQSEKIPSFYELAPDISLFLTSYSKVFSPSLRVGYAVVPERFIPRVVAVSKAINWTSSAVTLDLANHLVQSGVLHQHKNDLQGQGHFRFKLALGILKEWIDPIHHQKIGFLPHLWLRLPTTVTPSEFIENAQKMGVAVIGGDRFAMSRHLDDHYIRVCLMALPSQEQLEVALKKLAYLLETAEAQPLIS